MAIKGRDKEFRIPKVTFLEFKQTEMDRVLTMLFPRLKFDGYGSRKPPRVDVLQPDEFAEEILTGEEIKAFFKGFDQYPHILKKWVETDLLDVVNRGKANQAVASPRPLHGETYKFRNAKHCRDYSTSEQVYWMLFHARKGKGQDARDALKKFFFPGVDPVTDKYDSSVVVDVETQALLRFNQQVSSDMQDSREPTRATPLCIGQADLLSDDILRLLAYKPYIPKSIIVDYLKILIAFHMAIYHLKLIDSLPQIVKNKSGNSLCSVKNCPVNTRLQKPFIDCPHRIAMIIDMGDSKNSHISEMATKSFERFNRQISPFVQANYTIKKLNEMATYLCEKTQKLAPPSDGEFNVSDLVELLQDKHKMDRDAYFKFRLAGLVEETSAGSSDIDPEIRDVMSMGLEDFDAFIEILMAYRGKYHRKQIIECLDSLLQKNKDSGLIAISSAKGSKRRFVLGSKLLEVLLQLSVLTQEDGQFITKEIRIEELLKFLSERYGIYIDRLPENDNDSNFLDHRALRLNLETFKRRLREIGFYRDLSDAYITQKVSPRYTIKIK